MGYKINIYSGSDWVNVLKDSFVEIDNSNFSSTDLSSVLDEISDEKLSRNIIRTTGTMTASAFDVVMADVSGGILTINLPASASAGDPIKVIDITDNASTNPITISAPTTAVSIHGDIEDLLLDIDSGVVELIYDAVNSDWRIDIGGTYLGADTSDSLTASYLTLNSAVTGDPALNAGLIANRGTSADVKFHWNETGDYWELTEDGSNYYKVWHQGNESEINTTKIDGQVVTISTSQPSGYTAADLWIQID